MRTHLSPQETHDFSHDVLEVVFHVQSRSPQDEAKRLSQEELRHESLPTVGRMTAVFQFGPPPPMPVRNFCLHSGVDRRLIAEPRRPGLTRLGSSGPLSHPRAATSF